jgi:flagellar export protein FliJ
MKPFSFRLQTVARLRAVERDARRVELGQAEDVARQLETNRSTLDAELRETRTVSHQAARPGQLDLDLLQRSHQYQQALLEQLARLDEQLSAAREEVARHRERLLAADRHVKMLEKLRDRQLTEHGRQALLAEIRELDEIAQQQFATGDPSRGSSNESGV